jgi:hypothetical protein
LASVQAAFVMDTQPVPLQLFMPLQLFFADLHSDVPLQEFTPSQCMVAGLAAVSAANDTVDKAEVNNTAAAPAIAALDSFVICMIESSIVVERSDIAAPLKDPANTEIITQLSKLMLCSVAARSQPLLCASKPMAGPNSSSCSCV